MTIVHKNGPIDPHSNYSLALIKAEKYDQELNQLLNPVNNVSLAQLQTALFCIQTLQSLTYKQIEKTCSNLTEDERKIHLKQYVGWFNSTPVLVLTAAAVTFEMLRLFTLLSPQGWDKISTGASRLVGRNISPLNPTGNSPVIHLANDGASNLKRIEEQASRAASTFESRARATQMILQLAQAREQRYQMEHRLTEESLKLHKQNSLDPAVSQAGSHIQESLRNKQDAEKQDHDTKARILGG